MFSVVIPLYNKELSIKNTIQTVLDQTFQDFEIVVINDGSTDSSASSVEALNDPRIRLVHQENQGVSAARNRGIRESKHEWIVFLDGDDLWKERHLSIFAEMINKYPTDMVFCTSHTKSKKMELEENTKDIVVIDDYFKEVLQHVDFIWTSATCIHTAVFDQVGGFPIGINRGEDLDLWARIGKNYRIIRSKQLTAVYRLDSENKLTASKAKWNNSILSIIKLKGTQGYERKYYKRMLFRKMRREIKSFRFKDVFIILARYKFELLK